MDKSSFILYTDYYEQIEMLTIEQRGMLLTACMLYQLGEDLPEMDPVTKMCYLFISADMRRNNEKYERIVEQRAEAGRKGGKQTQANKANATFASNTENAKQANQANQANASDNDNDNDNDNENDNVNENETKTDNENAKEQADGGQSGQSGNTPTYEDVVKECREKKYSAAIASKFFMHYDRSGWKTNDGEPVRDWKKMLGIWVNNEKEEKPPNKRGKPSGWKEYQQRGTETNEELEAMLLDMGG